MQPKNTVKGIEPVGNLNATSQIATFERLKDELKQSDAEDDVVKALENYFTAQIARFKKLEARGK